MPSCRILPQLEKNRKRRGVLLSDGKNTIVCSTRRFRHNTLYLERQKHTFAVSASRNCPCLMRCLRNLADTGCHLPSLWLWQKFFMQWENKISHCKHEITQCEKDRKARNMGWRPTDKYTLVRIESYGRNTRKTVVIPSAYTSTGTHPQHLSGAGKSTCTFVAKPYAVSCKPPRHRPGKAPPPANQAQPQPNVRSIAPFAQSYLPHRPWTEDPNKS